MLGFGMPIFEKYLGIHPCIVKGNTQILSTTIKKVLQIGG